MLSFCGLMACVTTACNDKQDPIPPEPENGPKVTLTAGETTPSTIAFTILPTKATACAYMLLTEDQQIPSAAVVLSDGEEADSKKATPVTIHGLVPETTHVVVAAVFDGTTNVLGEPLRLTTTPVDIPDDAVVLDRMISAIYFDDSSGAEYASYYIHLANVACVKDEFNYYQPSAKGTLLRLDMLGEPSPEGNRALPAGTYYLDAHKAPQTINPYATGITRSDGSNLTTNPFESGQVIVERKGDTYTLTATFTDNEEAKHVFRYDGSLPIAERELPTYDPITENVNTTFIGADALYYGDRNKTGFGEMEVYLYDVPLNGGFLSEAGYMLNLKLTAPLIENGEEQFIHDGTYTVSDTTPAAMRFEPGYLPEGDAHPSGSFCEYNDQYGAPYYALITGGTIQFHRTGTTYTASFDLTTQEQITVKGIFTGEIPIENRTGWRPGGGGLSTLHMDVVPDLSGITTGKLTYLGNYLRLGYSSFILDISAEDQSESMEFEVICESTFTTDVAMGHYTVMPGRSQVNMVPWAVMPGFLLESNLAGTWYTERNENGIKINGAPANEGTVDISKEGDNYTIRFDLKDDCTEPNRISGSWTGPMTFTSSPFSVKAAPEAQQP